MLEHLQPAAHVVGGGHPLGGGSLEDGQHEVPDGVGRQLAVPEQFVEVLVAGLVLVEPVGGQQPVERLAGQPEALHRRRQLDERLVARGSGEEAVELVLDPVEGGAAVAGILVAEVVDEPGVSVDGPQMVAHGSGQQPQRDGEVLSGGPGHDRLQAGMAFDGPRAGRLLVGLRLHTRRRGRALGHSVH